MEDKTRKILLMVAVLGALISIYLTIEHYFNSILVCPESGIISCATVLNSAYSNILGAPAAVLAVIWFAVMALIIFRGIRGIASGIWRIFGVFAVLYSVTTMILLQKVCIYCSSLDILIICIVAIMGLHHRHKK